MTPASAEMTTLFSRLWSGTGLAELEPLAALLPRDEASLQEFYPRLREYVAAAPRRMEGTIDPSAIVRGEIVSMGHGSVIEPGAIIHESCRLILGPGSRIRCGAVLRDEVVVGPQSMIGVHCEVVRTVILGPASYLGHFVYLADSIVGGEVNVSGYVAVANTNVRKGAEIVIRANGSRVPTGRTHLGALIGDRVRLGASTTICPGTVIEPGLELPAAAVLLGVIDASRRDRLMRDFFERWS